MTEAEKAEFINRFDIMAGNIGNYSNESPLFRMQRERDERRERLPVSASDPSFNEQLKNIRDCLEILDPYIVTGLKMLGTWAWPDRNFSFYKSGLGRVVEGEAPISELFAGYSPLILAQKKEGVLASFHYNIKNATHGHRFYHFYPIFIDFKDGNLLSLGYNHSGADRGTIDLTNHLKEFTVDEMIRFFSMYFEINPKTGKLRS